MAEYTCPNCQDQGCDFCEDVGEQHPEEPRTFADVYGDDDYIFADNDDDPMDDYEDDDYEDEDDGQPSEYDEWQDVYGGDDFDHGQFDNDDGEF